MPTKRTSIKKKSSPQERKSGRQSSKQITYTEDESDDYSSGSEIYIEIDKIIDTIPVRKPPKKDKNVRNQGRQEKRKVDDSESDKESDKDSEIAEETPRKKSSKKQTESKQGPVKKQKTKVNQRTDEDDDSCQICNRTTKVTMRGSVQCCAACQAFFKKYYEIDDIELDCKEDDSCELDSTKYLQLCPSCRYEKCVELGMEAEEDSFKEGERKSSRIQSLEKNYKESDSESEDDIYIPIAKKKKKPNYYESSDEDAVVDSSEEEADGDDPNDLNWNPNNRRTLEDVTYGKRKRKQNCDVCRAWATVENHYGIKSCFTCVDLFRKALTKHHIPKCITKNKQCDVKSGKSKCKLCSVSRYLKLTMESDRYIDDDNFKEKAENLEELLLSDNPRKLAMRKNKCEICGALADCLTEGVKTCSSCTKFYKNCSKGKGKASKFKCLQSDMCKLNRGDDPVKYRYSFCKDCRYKKCLKVGMAKGSGPADE